MQIIGDAPQQLTKEELIAKCGPAVLKVMSGEISDDSDGDRIWLLRRIHKNYLYYRSLQYFAPSLYQGVVEYSGIAGAILPAGQDFNASGVYDYSQNLYRGYCRKLEAVLGLRMPNVIAVPVNADNEEHIKATKAANNAAEYINWHCDLQLQVLYLIFSFFNFGTSFWYTRFEYDADKYGMSNEPDLSKTIDQEISPAGFSCPSCGTVNPPDLQSNAPSDIGPQVQDPQAPNTCLGCQGDMTGAPWAEAKTAQVPDPSAFTQTPKGALEISLHDASEVSVPLSATCTETCAWLRWQREWHKSKCLKKWGDAAREAAKTGSTGDQTVSSTYGEAIRSAMASPIGIVRPRQANYWTVTDDWLTSDMYEMVDDKEVRQLLKDNFPKGARFTYLYSRLMDIQDEKLSDHWVEAKPEPAKRIMADPLGDDWVQVSDLADNLLNQRNEIIERSNDPGFGDPRYIDFDAWERRRDMPAELFPALSPAGKSMADIIYRPEPVRFSDQIQGFRQEIEETAKNISGELDTVWGGGSNIAPTARQQELMTNAALRQLGVPWKLAGKSLERVNLKSCKILADHQDGVLPFSKRDQFGKWQNLPILLADLKSDGYHFEAEEQIPLTWGQQRDLLMWMLDKPADLLQKWGFSDPLNIFEFKSLLGMPGEHVPQMDERDKAMGVIAELLKGKPEMGPDGKQQSSIQPSWEDDNAFTALLVRSYLNANPDIARDNPDGYQNLVLYGQAQEAAANQPAPAPPPKTSVAVSVKGADVGPQALQAILSKEGLLPDGAQVQPQPTPDVMYKADKQAAASAPLQPPAPGVAQGVIPEGPLQ